MPAEGIGGSHLATTSAALFLKSKVLDQVRKSYMLRTPLCTRIRARGKVTKTKRVSVEVPLQTGPSMNAGPRGVGSPSLPGEAPLVNGTRERLDLARMKLQVYLPLFYAGTRYDGPVADAASDGGAFGNMLRDQADNAAETIAFFEEIAAMGDGSQAWATVDSVAADVITLKVADSLANAGQQGLYYFSQGDWERVPLTFHNPGTGLPIGDAAGGQTGWLGGSIDEANNTLTLDRTAAGSLIADGSLIVGGGSDADHGYAKGGIGLNGWIDDGTVRESIYGHSRAAYRVLRSRVYSAADAGALGEWYWPLHANAARAAAFRGNDRVVEGVCHHMLANELIYGDQNNDGVARALPGLTADRRFSAKGSVNAGATGVTHQVPGFGTVMYHFMFGAIPNTTFYLDFQDMELLESKQGFEWLEGHAGPGGHYVRLSEQDVYDGYIRRRCCVVHRKPWSAARVNDQLMSTPAFF